MVSVKQYPDVMEYVTTTTATEPYQDDDGNWINPEPVTETVKLKCRAEANTKGDYAIAEDGQQISYGWVVYYRGKIEIPFGTSLTITRNGSLRASGTVKRSVVDQLNCKAWV